MVKVLDSALYNREFDNHTGHGSILKIRQFHSPHFASVYSAVNGYHHCWEGICDGLVSFGGQYNCTACTMETRRKHCHVCLLRFLRQMNLEQGAQLLQMMVPLHPRGRLEVCAMVPTLGHGQFL